MLPLKKPSPNYRTLDDIRVRKDQLYEELQKDNTKFSTLWGQLFVKQENATKGEYIGSLIANGITVIDLFLLARKLKKNYGSLLGLRKKRK
jgi:hypothetical protein